MPFFTTSVSLGKGRGQHAAIKRKVVVVARSGGNAKKSELGLVDTVHEGYIGWALIGRNKFTVQAYRDWTTV